MSTKRQEFILPSGNRTSGTINNATFVFNQDLIQFRPAKVKLIGGVLPVAWKNVFNGGTPETSNNEFVVDVGNGPVTVTIPPQFYTGADLAIALNAAFVTAGVGSISVTYNTPPGSYLFTFTGPENFVINVNETYSYAGLLLGLTGTITAPATTITSTSTPQIVDDYIYIKSDLVAGIDNGMLVLNPNATSGVGISSILAAIPTGCNGSKIVYTASKDSPFYKCTNSPFSTQTNRDGYAPNPSINVSLVNYHGLPLETMGEWTIILLFES